MKVKQMNRNESGLALVSVLSLGIIMSIWAYALAALIIPSFQKASQAKHANVMRSACEATLDWATNNLATNAAIDDVNGSDNNAVTTTLSPAQAALIPLPSGISARITVKNVVPPATSFVYDSTIPAGFTWRMVTASAWYTAKPGTTKRVTVILKPLVQQNVVFNYAAFGRNSITQTGNSSTDSVDTSQPGNTTQTTGGDIAAIGKITLGSNSNIGGNVISYAPPGADGTPGLPTPGVVQVDGGTGNTVHGHVVSYGEVDGLTAVPPPPAPSSGNVLNENPGSYVGPTVATNQGGATNPTPTVPTTPSAPAGAVNLGAINLSGNNTLSLAPGDYIVSSLSISGNAGLVLTGNSPVNIYVQGAGATISIGGNGITNTSAQSTNLRMWYSGTSTVNISGNGNMTGVIYAPNSTVRNVGNGTVTGAIVGNYINMNGNAPYHYDRALATVPITIPTVGSYQTVSWREQ